MAGPEIASLKNPGLAGEVQFDTVIYGSPPLAYSALLSQFAIYNVPDPAYVTAIIGVSSDIVGAPSSRRLPGQS